MPRASIDIGSNSILLLVVDDDGAPLYDSAKVVGLGAGIGHRGMFRADRMEAALEILREFGQTAESMGLRADQIIAVATSAARRAMNAQTFFERVQAETQIRVEIISGEREAELTWAGALIGLPAVSGAVAVVDLGGGSTEMVIGDPVLGKITARRSLELGSVRLTEKYFGADPVRYQPADLAQLRAAVQAEVQRFEWGTMPRALVAVAGTATTLCAMEIGMTQWDAKRIHGSRLGRAALRRWIDKLLNSSPDERRAWAATSPERADHLLAGACVLEAVCSSAHRDSLWISDGGVRHGVLVRT
jgi:exopolyphosphatase / guanosine-5'-triphosphate,3'-diphosphate pyrophosphatase